MKPKNPSVSRLTASFATALSALFAIKSASAADFYWDAAAAANWTTNTAWATTAAGGTDPAGNPGAADNVFFNIDPNNTTAATVSLAGGARSANSVTFSTSGATNLRAGGANSTGSLTIGSGGITMNSGAGPVTISQTPVSSYGTLTTILNVNQSWTNNSTSALIVAGPLSGSGNLQKLGTGSLVLNGASTGYSGIITGDGGTIQPGNNSAFGTNKVVMNAGTIYPTAASYTFANDLELNNAWLRQGGGNSRLLTWNGNITTTGSSTIYSDGSTGGVTIGGTLAIGNGATFTSNGSSTTNRINGNITGTGVNFNVDGATLELSAATNHTGTTTISNGSVFRLQPNGTILSSNNVVINGNPSNFNIRNTVGWVYNGTISGDGLGQINLNSGTNATLAGAVSGLASINVNSANTDTTISGKISGGSVINIQSSGNPRLTLSNTGNDFTGNTTIFSGTLRLGNSGVVPDATSVVFSPATGVTSTLEMNGFNETVGGLITNTAGNSVVDNTAASTNSTLTVNATANSTFAGAIRNTGAGATLALTKTGLSNFTLGGTNTYTGATTVNGGTLALSSTGTIDNTSGVVLGGGTFDVSAKSGGYTVANLSGNGAVLGSLTVSTQLAIGSSPGTVDFSALTLGSGSTFLYDMTGGSNTADLGNVSATLDLGGATLNLVQLGSYTPNDKFTLFAYQTGNLTNTFAGLADGALFTDAGGDWMINYFDSSPGLNGGTGTSFITITAIPEPGTSLLALLGAAALLRRKR
ncbi:autotransporter-associated beta strand repeat-containing protein [Akkermansiaceae bacterium]|nr:autotransporter-associated beta strand repeat-containing protein [Akkermansiaceae bacterium]